MKKRIILLLSIFTVTLLLFGCAGKGGDVSDVKIDYGKSDIYTKEDMDKAIEVIKKEFSEWDGCKLYDIRYLSDDANSKENIKWLNQLAKGQNIKGNFTEVIAFKSDYHSPKDTEGTAWEADTDYKDWQWWLARDGKEGDWILLSNGYG